MIKIALPILLLGLCYSVFSSHSNDFVWTSCENLQQQVLAYGIWAPILIFIGFIASSVAIIPGTALTMLSGLCFGLLWGTVLALAGISSGAILSFYVARTMGRETIEKILRNRSWFIRLQAQMQNMGLDTMIVLRLVPLFPFTGLNLACGLLSISSYDYILGSLMGMMPGTFIYVYFGRTGCHIMERVLQKNIQLADLPVELRWQLGIAFTLLGALSLMPLLWNWRLRRRGRNL
ncbi:MAG: TVP38/TMEM64 family protein [Proteobacteria bacterium]|nr:TVP38/TMEM64 family protein [Pseudomonadota bacterium]